VTANLLAILALPKIPPVPIMRAAVPGAGEGNFDGTRMVKAQERINVVLLVQQRRVGAIKGDRPRFPAQGQGRSPQEAWARVGELGLDKLVAKSDPTFITFGELAEKYLPKIPSTNNQPRNCATRSFFGG
jgi:hypothetical protein